MNENLNINMKPLTVLFVCVHNSGRSQMAEAFVNYEATAQNLSLRAYSAGTVEGKSLNTNAVQAMSELGISMSGQTPKLMTQEMADQADLIISMGCGVDAKACPAKLILVEDWGLEDPADQPIERVREIRDQIQVRVNKMIEEITAL